MRVKEQFCPLHLDVLLNKFGTCVVCQYERDVATPTSSYEKPKD